jgi:uncharacterized damage-inducible protein DinB
MDLLDRLLGHDLWSTRQLLLQARALSPAQLDQVFAIDSRTLRGCFVHIVQVMEVWNDLLYERTPRGAALDALPATVDGLLARLTEAGKELALLARRVARENRWDDMFVDVLDDPPRLKTFGGAIGHVITHNMHHRAQAMLMLEQLGVAEHIEGDLLGWEAVAMGWGGGR